MTQGEDTELSQMGRSIQSIFDAEEHQGPVSPTAPVVDTESQPSAAPPVEAEASASVHAAEPEVDGVVDPVESEFEPDVESEVDAPSPVFAADPGADMVPTPASEEDAPDVAMSSEPALETAEPVLETTEPEVEISEPEVGTSEPEVEVVRSSEEAPDAPDEDPPSGSDLNDLVGQDETSKEVEQPLSQVEQALGEATSNYLRAPAPDRAQAREVLREAVEDARSARALDAIGMNVDILLLQAAGDGEVEDMVDELVDADVSARMAVALGRVREEEQREALIEAYVRLGPSFAKAIAEVLTDTEDRLARKTYVAALGAFGEEGGQAVEEMLNDDRWFVVRNGVSVLGVVGEETGVGALTATLANEHAGVRRETVRSLAKIGGENAGLLVSSMLGDSDPEVRSAAASAITTLKVEKAYKPLMAILKGGDDEAVIEAVLRALGALGDASAVPAIEKQVSGSLFSRPPTGVRIAGYTALAAIGTPKAVSLVEKAKKDKDAEVSAAATQLLSGK